MTQNNNRDVISKGLQAAKDASKEEGMQNKVEELASELQGNASNTSNTSTGEADGVRYDYDDNSNL